MADIAVSAAPGFEARGRARVAYLATGRKGDENLYRARIALQDSDPRLRPGMRCTVVLVARDDGGVAARDPGQ